MRERLGIIDMTSFGKLETSDLDVLERVCGARIDRPVGSVVYTQLLDDRGRIVGDVTVTRLAEDRFRVVTGAGAVDSDRGFLELHGANVDDVTDELAVIGIWGPGVRGVLEDFPFRTAKPIRIGTAQRARAADHVRRRVRLRALRRTRRRGRSLGLPDEGSSPEPVGYQALDSLRIEKGYRYFGTDLTASDTPFDSGVGFAVAKGKHPELDRNPPTRLRTLLVGGEEYLTLYGGEAVHADGAVVGRVRSAAYGFTVQRNVALAKLPAQLARRSRGSGGRPRRARAGGRRRRRALRPGSTSDCAPSDEFNDAWAWPRCLRNAPFQEFGTPGARPRRRRRAAS